MTEHDLMVSGIDGNLVQQCIASMRIPKKDRDDTIFIDYLVYAGSMVYSSPDDTEPYVFGESEFTFSLTVPDYYSDFTYEPEVFESEDYSYDETKIEIIAEDSITTDAYSLNLEGTIGANFFSAIETNDDLNDPDYVAFLWEIDMPRQAFVNR